MTEKEKDTSLRCHWDGDFATWPDYVRKVRLAFEKTRRRRRAQLGPDLVSQLSGRAWVVTQEIDYKALTQPNGARYLITFLEERLARVPIPDAGSQAEALLLRLRRVPGTSMATWCAQVREQYRKLQRALRRARGDAVEFKPGGAPSQTSSKPRSSPEPAAEEGTEEEEAQRADEEEAEPRSPARPSSSKGGKSKGKGDDLRSPSRGSRSDPSDSEDEQDDNFWDDLDTGLPEVLPSELLGWIMLRKSSLNAAQRLNVLSSIGNSLKADDIEKGLRGAEDELRLVEKEREGRPKGSGKSKHRPSFWVEHQGEWGLLLTSECDDEDLLEGDIHWLGGLPQDQVFQTTSWETPSAPPPAVEETFMSDDGFWGADPSNPGAYLWWNLEADGEYYHCDSHGTFWSWSEADVWNDVLWSTPEESKPIVEAFAAYEEKMRSFQESRRASAAKNASRGFFPKGKFKGKSMFGKKGGKGKGFGTRFASSSTSSSSPSVMAVQGGGKPGSPGYQGCFICGAKDHDYRSCPRRSRPGGKGGKVFMVAEEEELMETFVCHPLSHPERPLEIMAADEISHPETEGFGVLDTGATETVAGLAALEWIMYKRHAAGMDHDGFQVLNVPNKLFKFGNGMTQKSESVILLPQRLGDKKLSLGIFTLEAQGVPVLVGIRTLAKLGALIDTGRSAMVLTAINASLLAPLRKSSSGHLLMDLSHDWLSEGTQILFASDTAAPSPSVKYSPSPLSMLSCFMVREGHVFEDCDVHATSTTSMPMSTTSDVSIFLSESELHFYQSLHGHEAEDFLSQCFAVRFHPPPPDLARAPEDANLADFEAQDSTSMSWRALTLLAATAAVFGSHVPSSSGQGQELGSELHAKGEEGSEDQRDLHREVRHFSYGPERPQRPSHPWPAVQRPTRAGTSLQRLGDREQWTCQLGRMPTVSTTLELHPGVRGNRIAPTSRADSSRHQEASRGIGRESTVQPADEESSHRLGRCRTLPPDQARQHPSSQSRSRVWQPHADHQCHFEPSESRQPDSAESDRGGKSDRRGDPWHGSWEQIPAIRNSARRSRVRGSLKPLLVGPESGRRSSLGVDGGEGAGEPYMSENSEGDLALRGGTFANSNDQVPKNERMFKNAQAPPNVKAPPNLFKFDYASGAKEQEAFEDSLPEGRHDGEPGGEDRTMTPFPKKEFAMVVESMNELVEEGDMIFKAHGGISSLQQWDVMELCCGPQSQLTEEVLKAGGRGGRIGLHNNCDLTKEEGIEKALELLKAHRPRWIWASFPCGPTSAVQALNERTPEGREKSVFRKRHARKVLRGGLRVLHEHLRMDGEIVWEWPRFNKAWKLPEVQEFWHALQTAGKAYEILADGCMFGLSSPDGPVKKPWRFMVTREHALKGLARQCDGSHHHVPCLGANARNSAYYTPQLCRVAARGMLQTSELIGGIQEVEPDPSVLEKLTPQELQHLMESVLKLHRLCGHPNNRALLKLLRARGASEELKAAALQLACPECHESKTASPTVKVSLEREDVIWKTLQMDAFFFRRRGQAHHFLLMLDEASSFAVVKEVKVHPAEESENITTAEVITTLEESWSQIFGYPSRLRCDAEGAFRGTDLAMWCSERGIDMIHVPAEHHQATGAVEKAIGELRWKMEKFLRNEPIEPKRAAFAMTQAHNHVTRVGGYAPAQWAFGRSENVTINVAAASSEGIPGHEMAENLRLRIEAEHLHNKLSAEARISRARNSRSKPAKQFIPGDIVFYQRYKVPRRAPANEDVDVPRMRIARWYGPARVLACETRVDDTGTARTPSSVVWLVSCGRLLKAHCDQVRHGSERELLIANASGTMAMPWTFSMMSNSLTKGAFEDLTSSKAERFEAKRRQTFRPSALERKRQKQQEEDEVQDDAMSSSSEELLPDEVHMDPTLKEGMHPDDSDDLDIERLLSDPTYMPLHPVVPPDVKEARGSDDVEFRQQRKRHEQDDRPHHAKFPKKYKNPDLVGWCSQPANDFVLAVTIDAPANEEEWRSILKDPKKYTSKEVKKGCEVAWHKLNSVQRQAMKEAKDLEVNSWVANRVCERAGADVPKSRLMKMRWVLVFKAVDDPNQPNKVKAKARIVILGFSDPDQEYLDKAAPTLSRRGKMLLLNLACHRRWRTLKADARAAFLQGSESQRSRSVFAQPVQELGEKMQCGPQEAVRLLRAAYGLVNAPREWYWDVEKIATQTCGMQRLTCEPCIWVCKDKDGNVQGAIASHVDDFIVTGNENSELWYDTLTKFHGALSWSPWESDPYLHCGIEVHQQANYSFNFDHSQYAAQIKQIDVDKHSSEVTPQELSQARAVLGSIQWRVSRRHHNMPHDCPSFSHSFLAASTPRRSSTRSTNWSGRCVPRSTCL